MNPLDLVIDLLWDLLSPINNCFIRNCLKLVLMAVLLIIYLFLFTKIAGIIPLFVKNKYIIVIIDVFLLVFIAAFLYLILFLLSRITKKS